MFYITVVYILAYVDLFHGSNGTRPVSRYDEKSKTDKKSNDCNLVLSNISLTSVDRK